MLLLIILAHKQLVLHKELEKSCTRTKLGVNFELSADERHSSGEAVFAPILLVAALWRVMRTVVHDIHVPVV